jgi:hypothetical protein
VELDRVRGRPEPSLLFRLVSKTSQPEPSHFTASQSLARTESGPSRLASSLKLNAGIFGKFSSLSSIVVAKIKGETAL